MPKDKENLPKQNVSEQENLNVPQFKDEDLFQGTPPKVDNKGEVVFSDSSSYTNRLIHKNLRFMQTIVLLCVIITAAMVCYMFFAPRRIVNLSPELSSNTNNSAAENSDKASRNSQEQSEVFDYPISLQSAKQLYKQGNYGKAIKIFVKLRENLIPSRQNTPFRDYLVLCTAMCELNRENIADALRLLRISASSDFNLVKIIANYQLCLIALSEKEFSPARMHSCQVLSLIDSINDDGKFNDIKTDCCYYTAVATTLMFSKLCNTQDDITAQLIGKPQFYELVLNIDFSRLSDLFGQQENRFQPAVLSPYIQKTKTAQTCYGYQPCTAIGLDCSIEELMSRFANSYGLELKWNISDNIAMQRRKMLRLYAPQSDVEQFVNIASGSVSLAADINDGTVLIYAPAEYKQLSSHLQLLYAQSVDLWQRFMLANLSDSRISNSHFALAWLYSQNNQIAEAINEFKLIPSKYYRSDVAPYALLQSAKLKLGLKDLSGACEDLTELVEQYTNSPITDKAYILLARTTAQLGDVIKAAKLFIKVYNMNYSIESRRLSALSAAESFYAVANYEFAVEWAKKYLSLCDSSDADCLYAAYFLIGKTYLAWDKFDLGSDALRYALGGKLSKQQYTEVVFALADGYIKNADYIQGLDLIESVDSWQLSQQDSMRLLIRKSRIYRNMSLFSKAITTLADRAEYIKDKPLKCEMLYEIALCRKTSGDYRGAYNQLMDLLLLTEPGNLNDSASLLLADICLTVDRKEQCLQLCNNLSSNSLDAEIILKANQLAAKVFASQQDYNRAAAILIDSQSVNN